MYATATRPDSPRPVGPKPAPPAPHALLALQRSAGNRAVGAALARKTTLALDGKDWVVKGRPGWASAKKLTDSLVAEWNQLHPKDKIKGKVNLTKEDLDRCHKLSWDNIRHDILEPFLNTKNRADARETMQEEIDRLWAKDCDDHHREAFKKVYEDTVAEAKRVDWQIASGKPLAQSVDRLAKFLNSARPNLRLDSHPSNISIQEKHDPHLRYTGDTAESGEMEWHATPRSKTVLWDADRGGYDWTPKHTRFQSSSLGGGFFAVGDATPDTREMMEED